MYRRSLSATVLTQGVIWACHPTGYISRCQRTARQVFLTKGSPATRLRGSSGDDSSMYSASLNLFRSVLNYGRQNLGGRVEVKVPRVGYVLVQPGTPEEQRLRMCWASPDRPERFFVPYTFVDACKVQNTLIKQIFLLNGKPMGIHIHQSIANVNVRAALTQRILVGFLSFRTPTVS